MPVDSLAGHLSNASLQPFRNTSYAYFTFLLQNNKTICRRPVGCCEAFMALTIHCLLNSEFWYF